MPISRAEGYRRGSGKEEGGLVCVEALLSARLLGPVISPLR
jgi:hypothetical protein